MKNARDSAIARIGSMRVRELESAGMEIVWNSGVQIQGQRRLVGLAEVAEILQVKKQQITKWRSGQVKSVKFPEPVQELANGPIWWEDQIRSFITERDLRFKSNQMDPDEAAEYVKIQDKALRKY